MNLTKTTVAKVAFSMLGVACLVLAGVTGYNYARTMEAYAIVTLTPLAVEVEFWNDTVAGRAAVVAGVNVTYRVDNPSRVTVELFWSQALVRMYDGGRESDFLNYYGFIPGEMRLEPGESRTFVMSGHAKVTERSPPADQELYWSVANRSAAAEWGVYCAMFYRVVEFEFSSNRYDGAAFLKEE